MAVLLNADIPHSPPLAKTMTNGVSSMRVAFRLPGRAFAQRGGGGATTEINRWNGGKDLLLAK